MNIKICFFCGNDSSSSKSVEHIIPESFGNDKFILEKGVVCDKCNNYFSRKIEGPILSTETFTRIRFYNQIISKKKNIPSTSILIGNEVSRISWMNNNQDLLLEVSSKVAFDILNMKVQNFFTPIIDLNDIKDRYAFSRFIGKVCIEFYVYLLLDTQKKCDYEEIKVDNDLVPFIHFIRYGNRANQPWNYLVEKIIDVTSFNNNEYIIKFDFYTKNNQIIFKLRLFNYHIHVNPLDKNYQWSLDSEGI